MSDIATKLTYLSETKGLIKSAINSAGANITDSTPFRDYATKLTEQITKLRNNEDKLLSYMPKGTKSGISISVDNAIDYPVYNLELSKESTQKTSILPSEYTQVDYIESHGTEYINTNYTNNNDTTNTYDLTFAVSEFNSAFGFYGAPIQNSNGRTCMLWSNASGLLQISSGSTLSPQSQYNGTYSLDSRVHKVIFCDNTTKKYSVDGSGNYAFSGTSNNSSNILLFTPSPGSQMFVGKLYSFKLSANGVLVRNFIPCYRNSDSSVGLYDLVNGVFYTNAGTGAFTYGSVANIPNPIYPQEIKTIKGYRNLFDESLLVNKNFNTTTGDITVDNSKLLINEDFIVLPEGTYTISTEYVNQLWILAYDDSGVYKPGYYQNQWKSVNRFTFTVSSYHKLRFGFNRTIDNERQDISPSDVKIMLSEGDIAQPYVPYGTNWIYTKTTGKNMLNINDWTFGSISDSGGTTTTQTNARCINFIQVRPGTAYTLSTNVDVTGLRLNEYAADGTHIQRTTIAFGKKITITTTSNTRYLKWSLNYDNSTVITDQLLSGLNLQLEAGSDVTTYEAYKERIVTLPLNENELAGKVDNRDKIIIDNKGHCWLSKKVYKVILAGTENWTYSTTNYTLNCDVSFNYLKDESITTICDHYKSVVNSSGGQNAYTKGDNTISLLYTSDLKRIYIRDDSMTNADDFKEWLSNNNVTFYYAANEPTLINLNYTVDLSLFDGLSLVSNSEGADMSLTYIKDINSILTTLSTPSSNGGGN